QSGVIKDAFVEYATKRVPVELRANFLPTGDGLESIVIRVQERENHSYNLKNIGLLPFQQQMIEHLIRTPAGLALINGKTGSGKNTTLIAMIEEYGRIFPDRARLTAEDPVEIRVHGVTQLSIIEQGENRQATLRSYEKGILRHDPELIVIGEVRDRVAAEMVVESANLGHLVMTTLHTENSIKAITRLLDLDIPRYKVESVLKYSIAQRLVRRICTECEIVEDDQLPDLPRLQEYIELTKFKSDKPFVRATGRDKYGRDCGRCGGARFYGRIGIFEILRVSNAIRELIYQGASLNAIRVQALADGFRSMWSVGLERALNGETTLGEIVENLGYPDPDTEGLPITAQPDAEFTTETEFSH
ncbi:MAG: ATPase, T2SS/T4P/T4SS family, partial [Acidobacteriota bacterium]